VLSHCSIWKKLLFGAAMLFLIVVTLSVSGILGVSSYRQLVRAVSDRANELPLAEELTRSVDSLRYTASLIRQWHDQPDSGQRYNLVAIREMFRLDFIQVKDALTKYETRLDDAENDASGIGDRREEREAVRKIRRTLERIETLNNEEDWVFKQVELDGLGHELDQLHELASGLPLHLQRRMLDLKGNVRGQYHTLIFLTWTTSALAMGMLVFLVRSFWDWVIRPLRLLIQGSRQVATGDFDHRIQLHTHDEMAELATAMNEMTARFQQIRDDLDHQVKQRTREAVQREQLASVGFLAAGVAHEINNPLASIAWCAEALESRLHDTLYGDSAPPATEPIDPVDVLRRYLRRIQDEAFRCKGITERLLDFSRIGEVERQAADLASLTRDVIDMVRHLGRYRGKRIVFVGSEPVLAHVNAQEIKQVVLNLIVNALDSLESHGRVEVEVRREDDRAVLCVADNGCGMDEEVLTHLFEPFFTRRRGGQGTGLGLSIAFRIVVDHGGKIEAHSDGPGKGSSFHVSLPLVQDKGSHERQPKAA
jgi:signal transduction histidine kinase